jgi:virginiamycin A acetyltransferase
MKCIKNIINSIKSIVKLIFYAHKINIDELRSFLLNSTISKKAKIHGKYHIVDTFIDDYTYLSNNCLISNTEIGKYCSIGPNFLCGRGIHPTTGISTSPMFYSTKLQNGVTVTKKTKIEETKKIIIGNDVYIGSNVTILDGVNIGDGAVIGAGALVSKDIPPYAVAVGCPISVVKFRFSPEKIESLLKIKWWNLEPEKIHLDIENNFFDIDSFISKYERKIK